MKKEDAQRKAGNQKILRQVREKKNITRHRKKDATEGKSKFAMMCEFL